MVSQREGVIAEPLRLEDKLKRCGRSLSEGEAGVAVKLYVAHKGTLREGQASAHGLLALGERGKTTTALPAPKQFPRNESGRPLTVPCPESANDRGCTGSGRSGPPSRTVSPLHP